MPRAKSSSAWACPHGPLLWPPPPWKGCPYSIRNGAEPKRSSAPGDSCAPRTPHGALTSFACPNNCGYSEVSIPSDGTFITPPLRHSPLQGRGLFAPSIEPTPRLNALSLKFAEGGFLRSCFHPEASCLSKSCSAFRRPEARTSLLHSWGTSRWPRRGTRSSCRLASD